MNENTTKLLQDLAAKLGTTAQYLWAVLIKQAPIDATISLIQLLLVLIFGFILYKVHRKLCSNMPGESHDYYYEYEEGAAVPMVLATILFIILLLAVFMCYPDNIINGYFNPEYWALQEVLSTVNP